MHCLVEETHRKFINKHIYKTNTNCTECKEEWPIGDSPENRVGHIIVNGMSRWHFKLAWEELAGACCRDSAEKCCRQRDSVRKAPWLDRTR